MLLKSLNDSRSGDIAARNGLFGTPYQRGLPRGGGGGWGTGLSLMIALIQIGNYFVKCCIAPGWEIHNLHKFVVSFDRIKTDQVDWYHQEL